MNTWTQEGQEEGGMNWETGIDMYTLVILCINQKTNENVQCSTGNPTQCSAMT